jgi:hypothetical protein
MHLDGHSRIELGRERIDMLAQAAERDRLRRSLADERGDGRQRHRLLQRARRRFGLAQARAQ